MIGIGDHEALVGNQELMNDILHNGGCPTSAGLLETVMAELRFPDPRTDGC